ncbi:MAG TPA: DUF4388 domain-containing protein [Pyrinomonadaceae bacterium]|nr:DUF4388 domain-containing protein [Pyrinomonadaceae bacterium]
MTLNGQLSDLHLSELIEFFCNQRKTGRLKIDYPLAPGVFFIHEGDLVDAKVGALNGKDAVFFALTLASATFDFSPGMSSSRRTINESWASVVLEGLRRIDEGAMPDFDVFNGEDDLDEATREYLECVEESKASKTAAPRGADAQDVSGNVSPLSMTVDAANNTGGRSKAMIAGVAAALVLVCAVAAIPVSRKLMRKGEPAAAQPQAQSAPATQSDAPADADAANAPLQVNASDAAAAEDAAAAARRDQQQREARERARKAREEAAKNAGQDQTLTGPPKPATPAGAKTVRVQITYDDAGRVTQAAAVGTSPGAEAYASAAVRIARSRHFAPGKAGSTVVTIPIN